MKGTNFRKNNSIKRQTKLFRYLLSRYLYRITVRLWSENEEGLVLSPQNIKSILDSSWEKYEARIIDLEKQGNLGNWLVMNFAYLTLSAYQIMVDSGIDKEVAIDMIREMTWEITSSWANRAKRVSKYIFQDQLNQLKYFVDIIMKTFFSPPGYKFEQGKTENGFYLDVQRCPVAELMISNGASDLCITTWCGVDFGLVESLGGSLQRTGTLAMGKKKCDFVFSP